LNVLKPPRHTAGAAVFHVALTRGFWGALSNCGNACPIASNRAGNHSGLQSFFKTEMQEIIMGSTSDKASGMANKAAGNIKEGVGKAVGSEQMQAEGKAQQMKGEAQKAMGEAKDKVKDVANKANDAVQKKF
jgi:uncharacterized protein YjbJ (UPF0337 family)